MSKILLIFGTRPEAIKLCPVIRSLREHPAHFDVRVCVTAQHREMLDQVLQAFEVKPDYDLDIMLPGQTLFESTSRILPALEPVFTDARPDLAIVQGDTTTTLCGALASFYKDVPVAHVEAGLRTSDMRQPFPEEMNRVLTSRLTALHFAPTDQARENLCKEGVAPESIHVTGNTGIDAVLYVRDRLARHEIRGRDWSGLDPDRKLIVVTAHRRESFGQGFEQICDALRQIADLPGVQLIYPVHPNPNVSEPIHRNLTGHPHIRLIEPLDYVSFVDLMRRAYLIVTDSGGIQEEAPSLGKPVLVLREKTERPEAVEAGTATLVGTDVRKIVDAARELLDNPEEFGRRCRIHNPYGDGQASGRIAAFIAQTLQADC
jgi:UDP-N-acetylglucosamine 2-epimerase (non-hydrolysing)